MEVFSRGHVVVEQTAMAAFPGETACRCRAKWPASNVVLAVREFSFARSDFFVTFAATCLKLPTSSRIAKTKDELILFIHHRRPYGNTTTAFEIHR
ncbi:hypothetical protein EDS67_02470 [candidate division KSB1 bacterium]|nr:MAG: hypothetical protein EDS67_02470 [candidate division KSB1 bacterium]MBC6948834.1 hypothetical protein [candidate division KSB1 bacterium]MCE7941895.1 hypothetical protein [Chlorobi bacterium CHB1]